VSRGPGSVQQHILELLTTQRERQGADRWRSINGGSETVDANGRLEWQPPTRAEQSAIRRALRTLEARGLIEVKLLPRRPGIGGPMPAQLVARLPLSVAHAQSKDNTYALRGSAIRKLEADVRGVIDEQRAA
jgi:hypothetical protein